MEHVSLGWPIAGLILLILPFAAVGIIRAYLNFTKELRFLNNEIGRTEGEEKRKWKKERRRLFLSLFPFVRY